MEKLRGYEKVNSEIEYWLNGLEEEITEQVKESIAKEVYNTLLEEAIGTNGKLLILHMQEQIKQYVINYIK